MVPLASKFEYLIDILGISLVPTCILILILNINFNLYFLYRITLRIFDFNRVTFGVVKILLMDELTEERLWYCIVCHCVSGHLKLVEIIWICNYIGLHALIVNQIYFQSVIKFNILRLNLITSIFFICVFLPNYS